MRLSKISILGCTFIRGCAFNKNIKKLTLIVTVTGKNTNSYTNYTIPTHEQQELDENRIKTNIGSLIKNLFMKTTTSILFFFEGGVSAYSRVCVYLRKYGTSVQWLKE